VILYQDSDSLFKRYLEDEKDIEIARAVVAEAETVMTSWLSYAAMRAALGAAHRAKRFPTEAAFRRARLDFESDWLDYIKIDVTKEIVIDAGSLAEKHSLRGADAVHLASVLAAMRQLTNIFEISTWDAGLRRALVAEGLVLAHD
jgi:predicted nucleic acid-binding protein